MKQIKNRQKGEKSESEREKRRDLCRHIIAVHMGLSQVCAPRFFFFTEKCFQSFSSILLFFLYSLILLNTHLNTYTLYSPHTCTHKHYTCIHITPNAIHVCRHILIYIYTPHIKRYHKLYKFQSHHLHHHDHAMIAEMLKEVRKTGGSNWSKRKKPNIKWFFLSL